MTLRQLLIEATALVSRRDAETLLQHVLGRDRAWLMAHIDDPLPAIAEAELRQLAGRRATQEPLQHITGTQEFFGLPLRVTPDVLIPRPETEHLVEAVLDWAPGPRAQLTILDVGTGSGAIALALASRLPNATLLACDISFKALAVAQENAVALGLSHRVNFVLSDLLDELQPELAQGLRLDAIVSNPPYIPLSDAPTLEPEVVDHEPHSALFAGDDGLETYRRLIPAAHDALRPGGLLALEFGFGQRDALHALFESSPADKPWSRVRFLNDYAGIPRVALANRTPRG
jgi:release factor glutamine methyltransferase